MPPTQFFKEVKLALSRLAVAHTPASGAGAARVLLGEAAVAHKFNEVQEAFDAKQTVDLGDLRLPTVFGWVLSREQQEQVKRWRSTAVAAGSLSLATSASGAGCGCCASTGQEWRREDEGHEGE